VATFAIARRDVESREQKCKEVEEAALQMEQERDSLRSKIQVFEQEQSDLKNLLEELVQERTSLRQENDRLVQEKNSLAQGAQRSRATLASLENNMKRLDKETEKWQARASELEKELNSTRSAADQIQGGIASVQAENEDLKRKFDEFYTKNKELQDQLDVKAKELRSSQENFDAKSSQLGKIQKELEEKATELQQSQSRIAELSSRLGKIEEELNAKSAELDRIQEQNKGNTGFPGSKDSTEKARPNITQVQRPIVFSKTPTTDGRGPSAQPLNATKPGHHSKLNRTAVPPPRAGKAPPSKEATQTTKARKVPFRKIRKLFSRTTGIHGAFTRPSDKGAFKGPPPRPKHVPPMRTDRKAALNDGKLVSLKGVKVAPVPPKEQRQGEPKLSGPLSKQGEPNLLAPPSFRKPQPTEAAPPKK
jgi:predicted nuclease with TOPRIM domain